LGSISKGRPEKIISKLIRAYLLSLRPSLRPDKMKNFLICYVYLYLILLEKIKKKIAVGRKQYKQVL
jgi:hypothetical protein